MWGGWILTSKSSRKFDLVKTRLTEAEAFASSIKLLALPATIPLTLRAYIEALVVHSDVSQI